MGLPLYDPEEWMVAAGCLGHTNLFFASDTESRRERNAREARAKAVCRECEVQDHCLSEAMKADERFGIWGGLTERERRRLKSVPVVQGLASDGPAQVTRLPVRPMGDRAMSASKD